MTFRQDKTDDFLAIFRESRQRIRDFPGCLYLELWQDYHLPHVYLTYSHWESEDALNHYRQSQLFTNTWGQTKELFAEKAQVFSMKQFPIT